MVLDSNIYTHELDRAALKALKAIPGFTQLLKAFMNIWNEQIFRVTNMATHLRISEKQLPKYYNMLPPICDKLGIDIPELYLEQNVVPNAYTSGDTKPFIVMTTGLLETMPEELIPTVLAHECGHIACHHVLYHTMGSMILNEAASLLGLGELELFPIKTAFYYWMRCSEYSADRAAAVCDGSADKIVSMCMHFAGFDKDIKESANVAAFMEQAVEYKQLTSDSKWSKTLEFIMYSQETHPLNAVRAYECDAWARSDSFPKIIRYLGENTPLLLGDGTETVYHSEIPMPEGSKHYVGQNVDAVVDKMRAIGFVNINLARVAEKMQLTKSRQVLNITVDGNDFSLGTWCSPESVIEVTYYEPYSEEEIIAMHPGEIRIPDGSKRYIGRDYQQVMDELKNAGFFEIIAEPAKGQKKSWLVKEGSIAWITVDGQPQFEKGDWFQETAPIRIAYHSSVSPIDFLNK